MQSRTLNKLIREAIAIEEENAKEVGAIGYMARVFAQATMPHRDTNSNEYSRTNGFFTLSMMSPSNIGVPYGSYPRLILAWLTTEAVLTKSPNLELGATLSEFMKELGILSTGGRWGTISRLREQMIKLFSSSISCSYRNDENNHSAGFGMKIAKSYDLWWQPKSPEQISLWQSHVVLSSDFFDEIIARPVPVDKRVLRLIKKSPMQIDIYCWLTYRMSYLKKPTQIPWELLKMQFGSNYKRTRAFKEAFTENLQAVLPIYSEAKVEEGSYGLILKPSKTHISKSFVNKSIICE